MHEELSPHPYEEEPILAFTIPGNQPRKSNSRRTLPGGKSIKSDAAQDYVKRFKLSVKKEWALNIDRPCRVEVHCYYSNKQSDLSLELFADMCEECGIVLNDNYFKSQSLDWLYDPDNPRVECRIFLLKEFPESWLVSYKKKKTPPKNPARQKDLAQVQEEQIQKREAQKNNPRRMTAQQYRKMFK